MPSPQSPLPSFPGRISFPVEFRMKPKLEPYLSYWILKPFQGSHGKMAYNTLYPSFRSLRFFSCSLFFFSSFLFWLYPVDSRSSPRVYIPSSSSTTYPHAHSFLVHFYPNPTLALDDFPSRSSLFFFKILYSVQSIANTLS